MAQRLSYDVKPTRTEPTAHEELERLLQTLHESGALRLANDLVSANGQILQTVMAGLGKEGSLNALQNLAVLMMALSRIRPGDLYKLASALTSALDVAGGEGEASPPAPGITGAYKMLNDDDLWAGLWPLLRGLQAFSGKMASQDIEKPITAFSGKETEA